MDSREAPIVVTVVDDVIFVAGEIDLMTAPELDECLGAAEGDVRIDMSAVTFVDSVGLSVLITHHGRRLRDGGSAGVGRAGSARRAGDRGSEEAPTAG